MADATDDKVVEELNIADYNAAVMAIGENIESSILITMNLSAAGLDTIWVKTLSPSHHRILNRIGATRIIHPECEMGIRVAKALNYPMVQSDLSLGEDEYIVDVVAMEEFHKRTLHDLLTEAGAKVTLLAIKRVTQTHAKPPEDFEFVTNDHIVLLGTLQELKKIAQLA